MTAFRTHLLVWIATGAGLALAVRPAAARDPELVPPRWALWTVAGLQVSAPVGEFQPTSDPNQPGLSLTALLISPSGAWGLRAHVEASRYRATMDDAVTVVFGGTTDSLTFKVQDASDLLWALAGPQWGSDSWIGKPHVYAMAGAASLHARLEPLGELRVYDYGAPLESEATGFAAAIGAGARWPLDSRHRFELTTDADYRWTTPLDYVTTPLSDSSGDHLQWRRSSIEQVSLRLGLGVRWGGD